VAFIATLGYFASASTSTRFAHRSLGLVSPLGRPR
jgi:hypothetical protein